MDELGSCFKLFLCAFKHVFFKMTRKARKEEKLFTERISSKNKMSDKLNYIKTPLPHLHFLFKRDASGKDGYACMLVCGL